jgi:hypothetical protein
MSDHNYKSDFFFEDYQFANLYENFTHIPLVQQILMGIDREIIIDIQSQLCYHDSSSLSQDDSQSES